MAKLNTFIRGAQIASAVAGDGLVWATDDAMAVNVDDSSIEVSGDALQVKALGITNAMLAGSIAYSKLVLTGEILNADLAGSIADDKLAEDYIKTSEVDGTTIEFGGGTLNVVAGGIDTTQLAADAVDGTKIADDSIDSEHYVDGSIDEAHIANDAVTQDKIADNAVGNAQMADDAVDVAEINTSDAPGDGEVLTYVTDHLEWTAKTAGVTEDYIQEGEIQKATFAGDDVTTEFDLGDTPVANSVQVFLNGLLQEEGSGKDYTLADDDVTFATAPASGDIIQIHSIAT
jgi:hypothetical protein